MDARTFAFHVESGLSRYFPGESAESLARLIPDGTDTGDGLGTINSEFSAVARDSAGRMLPVADDPRYGAVWDSVDSLRSPRERGEFLSERSLGEIRAGYLEYALELSSRWPARREENHGESERDTKRRRAEWRRALRKAFPGQDTYPEDPNVLWEGVTVSDFDSESEAKADRTIRGWFASMADVRGFTLAGGAERRELESIGSALFLSANEYTCGFQESRYGWPWGKEADERSGSVETMLEFNVETGKVSLF